MKRILLTTVAICFGFLAQAEENTSPPMQLAGGMICDTLDDVIAFLEDRPQTTCGRLQRPIIGTVTPIVTYEARGARFNLVRYDFLQPTKFNSVQFGWFGRPVPLAPQEDPGEAA